MKNGGVIKKLFITQPWRLPAGVPIEMDLLS